MAGRICIFCGRSETQAINHYSNRLSVPFFDQLVYGKDEVGQQFGNWVNISGSLLFPLLHSIF